MDEETNRGSFGLNPGSVQGLSTKRETEIDRAVSSLKTRVGDVHDLFNGLEAQMSTALRNEPNAPKDALEKPGREIFSSPLAEAIATITSDVDSLADKIKMIRDKLYIRNLYIDLLV